MKEDLKKGQEKNLDKQDIYSQSKEQNKVVKDAEEIKSKYSPYFYGTGSCCSPNTKIRVPNGEIKIVDIREGDLVVSDDGKLVPVIQTNKVPVKNHKVVCIKFSDGTKLEVSSTHPTSDGRMIGELILGDVLDGRVVTSKELKSYKYDYTYDILPNSPAGNYYANGILLGSTLSVSTLKRAS